MMMVMGFVIFSAAMALATAAIWLTVAPQWRRVVRLAMGQVETPCRPLGALARAEHRIAVKRWAAAPMPAPLRRLRAAA